MKCVHCQSEEAEPGVVFCAKCYEAAAILCTDNDMQALNDRYRNRESSETSESGELTTHKLVSMLGVDELRGAVQELSKALAIIACSEEAVEPHCNATTGKTEDGRGFTRNGHENCVRLANEALRKALPQVYV